MKAPSKFVLITGASSGIGRALALECARRGWHVALVARRASLLEGLAEECRALGVDAVAAPADVTDPPAFRQAAETVVQRFGRIDAWVNGAGVYAVGRFEETPDEAFRRVIDVDLLGVVTGSRLALEVFRRQGRGVLINVSSMVGGLGSRYVSAYAAAKWAVRGFSDSLREELTDDSIEVCVVRPAAIDTPIFRRAGNYSGRAIEALSPTYPVEDAARTIANLVEKPRREVIIGGSGKLLSGAHALAPNVVDRVFSARMPSNHFASGKADRTDGNLFTSDEQWAQSSGDWPHTSPRRARVIAGVAAAATLAAAAAVLTRA